MSNERGSAAPTGAEKASKSQGLFGSLKDVLRAAGREETPVEAHGHAVLMPPSPADVVTKLSAEEAARLARGARVSLAVDAEVAAQPNNAAKPPFDAPPPTTRVLRRDSTPKPAADEGRTVVVRGKQAIQRSAFACDPVVAFLVIVGGPGLGAFRPVYEGNNTIGRSGDNRIALDFGDETISADAQAYLRYDASDRSFLFVPNLAKTNIVSVNDKRPTTAIEVKPMDVITLGRTQVAFVPFCGTDFDWSEISDN